MKTLQQFSEPSAVRNYLRLMYELITRINLVTHACDGKLNLALPYVMEYCYLQFRQQCEIIAVGCLQMHGDIPAARTREIKKKWNAEEIMQLLLKEHPHSFPQCVTKRMDNGRWYFQGNSKPNALTLQEFKTLYHECGKLLHLGSIKSIEAKCPLGQKDYEKVIFWQSKIVELMNQHVIARSSGDGIYFISLESENNLPACTIFSNFGENTVEVAEYNMKMGINGIVEAS